MSRRRALPTWTLVVGIVVGVATHVVTVAVFGTRAPASAIVRELVMVAAWTATGLVAVAVGRRHLGRLMLVLALLFAVILSGGFGVQSQALWATMLQSLAMVLVPAQAAVAGHVILAFPSGSLDTPSRRLLMIAYPLALVEGFLGLWYRELLRQCEGCARPLDLGDLPGWVIAAAPLFTVTWLGLVIATVVLLVRRYRRSSARMRHILAAPYVGIGILILTFTVLLVLGEIAGTGPFGVSWTTVALLQALGLLAVPAGFLLGLMRERLSYAGVSDLVTTLAAQPATDGRQLRDALARALGDPTLEIAFPLDGRYVSPDGEPVLVPHDGSAAERRSGYAVGDAQSPMAVLVHDRSLDDEPELLSAVGSAARLALENARLQAEIRAQLVEVRASRERIVVAEDEARRRIERDLHDGAQQHLLAIGLALQMLRRRNAASADTGVLLTEAEGELARALSELRELAAGIHPSVLTDLGLVPALRDLAARSPVPAAVAGTDPGRLPASSETAAYFSVAEAVTNAAKHSMASRIDIRVVPNGTLLRIIVRDDGCGGADPSGHGLAGIADRLAAVGGRLEVRSDAGRGTDVVVEVPCASS